MNEIKKAIDETLQEVKFSKSMFEYKSKAKQQKRMLSMPRKRVQVLLCTLMLATTLFASSILLRSIVKVNGQELPELEPMYVVSVSEVESETRDEYGLKKYYRTMAEAEADLDIKLLGTQYTQDNPYISVEYEKIGSGYNLIKVSNYETGDLTDLTLLDEDKDALPTQGRNSEYIWTLGDIYKTPVDLEIEIISSEEQPFLDTEYLGYFEYVETYTSGKGYRVNILQDAIDADAQVDLNRYRPQIKAIFVAEGIRYTLSGRVPMETMKELIETME